MSNNTITSSNPNVTILPPKQYPEGTGKQTFGNRNLLEFVNI
jgi:hypothetical protein